MECTRGFMIEHEDGQGMLDNERICETKEYVITSSSSPFLGGSTTITSHSFNPPCTATVAAFTLWYIAFLPISCFIFSLVASKHTLLYGFSSEQFNEENKS